MSHIGIFCPPLPGHLHPVAAVGRALVSKGHRVTVFQLADFEQQVRKQGLDFCAVGPANGLLAARVEEMGRAQDLKSLRMAVEGARQSAENICLHAPQVLQDQAVDLLLVDQNEPAGGTVAEHLKLQFLSVCPSLPLNREPAIPPPFVDWPYSRSALAVLRNAVGLFAADRLIAPINRTVNRHRKAWGLAPLRTPDDSFSKVAQLSQMVRDFDFPRQRLPQTFHYLGPWLEETAEDASGFPYGRLDERPLVYASFGTLQPNAGQQFRKIAEACHGLNLQLILAAGATAASFEGLPGNPIVVAYAPQLALLPKASVVITHGGMNTVMQTLRFGKPMLVIPQTHDQPAIAARVKRCGAGLVISAKQALAGELGSSLARILGDPSFGKVALLMERSIQQAGGLAGAVEMVEGVLRRGQKENANQA